MKRRHNLVGLISFLAFPAVALPDALRKALQDALEEKSPIFLGAKPLPIADPAWDEVNQLLANAPSGNATPFDVAQYLNSKVPERYQAAWPKEFANPLVMQLFLATNTKPTGDTTPWCGAFVNWCFARCGVNGTESASAISFADWGNAAWKKEDGPLPEMLTKGDIAVFRLKSNPVQGHVAFVVARSTKFSNTIEVLGGNQISKSVHRIHTDPLRTVGDLELISIRTHNRLHRA